MRLLLQGVLLAALALTGRVLWRWLRHEPPSPAPAVPGSTLPDGFLAISGEDASDESASDEGAAAGPASDIPASDIPASDIPASDLPEPAASEPAAPKEEPASALRELQARTGRLQRLLEERATLLGVAAHDLKTPIMGIRALAEVLLDRGTLSPDAARKLRLIHASAQEAMRLTEHLLSEAASDITRALEHHPVDLAALSAQVARTFSAPAERKNQRLRLQRPDPPCLVLGEKRRLREAISNLVSNAVKYAPPGTAVQIRVAALDQMIEVAVTDRGPGLSAADQRRLFRPFEQLSPQPTGGESSSGLGLYIAKQVADLHGGTVQVTSVPGEGSTFTLVVPRYVAAPSGSDPTDPDPTDPDPTDPEPTVPESSHSRPLPSASSDSGEADPDDTDPDDTDPDDTDPDDTDSDDATSADASASTS